MGKRKKASTGGGGKKKKERKERPPRKVWTYYKIEGDSIVRLKKECPNCGAGFFMAQHKDRLTCGHCHYTEFLEATA